VRFYRMAGAGLERQFAAIVNAAPAQPQPGQAMPGSGNDTNKEAMTERERRK